MDGNGTGVSSSDRLGCEDDEEQGGIGRRYLLFNLKPSFLEGFVEGYEFVFVLNGHCEGESIWER